MKIIFYILRMTASVLLGALELLMLMRALLNRLGLFQDLPLDIAFFLSFCVISVARLFL